MHRTEWNERLAANDWERGGDCWNRDLCYYRAFRDKPTAVAVELHQSGTGLWRDCTLTMADGSTRVHRIYG